MLRIYLFGMLDICHDEQHLPSLPTQKATSLFGYLVTKAQKKHAREILAEMLWPDASPQRSRNNLNTAIWHIRTAFKNSGLNPELYLQADSKTIRWQPVVETWTDTEEFERVSAEETIHALEQAANLYRSPLLTGVYDDWCLEQRYALEEKYQNVLLRMVREYQKEGQHQRMLQTAHALLAVEPLHEEAARAVVVSSYRLGNRAAAIQFYQLWRKKLNCELGVEPEPGLQAFYEQMLDGGAREPKTAGLDKATALL